MANDLDQNPLRLDTAAVVSATALFHIKKIVLVPAAAAATAELRDGQDRTIALMAAAANGGADVRDFSADPLVITGLELQAIAGAGAVVEVYCG